MNKSVKPLSVEDGMSGEQAVQLLRDLVEITTGWTFSDIKDAQSNALGVIGQQAWEVALRAKEFLAAAPVVPPAVPVEERTAIRRWRTAKVKDGSYAAFRAAGVILDELDGLSPDPEALVDAHIAIFQAKPIPEERTATLLDAHMKDPEFAAAFNEEKKLLDAEERTAEMEQLIGRLRELAMHASSETWSHKSEKYGEYVMAGGSCIAEMRGYLDGFRRSDDAEFIATASPENILKLLDHIEGKAKAEEVQE